MANMPNLKSVPKDAVVRRLYARGKWKLDSVAHFGGDETGIEDMSLLRDENENPFIPGASIAGAARSFLARQSLPWSNYADSKNGLANEPAGLKRVFGGGEKADSNKPGTMSALIISDAACVPKQVKISIRDGIRVEAQSGTAADKAKFDIEVLERGTEFELSMQCVIRRADEEDKGYDLTEWFLALLHAFQQGEVRLGARTRRGYGKGRVATWEIRDLRMYCPQDVMAWLRNDAWTRPESALVPRSLKSDQRRYFHIEADFKLHTSLLIRSSSEDPKAPDMVHLHSNGEPVVPGTSFAGAFRHRAALIANALGWCKKDGDKDAVCEMFGPVHEQKRSGTQQETDQVNPEENIQRVYSEERDEMQQKDLWASRVWIEERLVKNVEAQWQDRVAIDRFTGGSLQSALFNEKPVYPLRPDNYVAEKSRIHIQLRLTLEEPEDAEIGLLLLTLRDFWHGHAALGGETSNGRGTLKGVNAKLRLRCPDSPKAEVWEFSHQDKRMTLAKGNKAFLECCVEQAQGYSNNPVGSRRPDTK